MILREESLRYHAFERPGKISVRPTKPSLTPREMRLAYLPGASFPAEEIRDDPSKAFDYTSRGNVVGVITNGTSVPGLGNIGPAAAKTMLEGVAVLFKQLADIDVFDLELDTTDANQIIEAVRLLEPSFGAINLKDIRAPEGLYICDQLTETMSIPVFHENLYSTAVVAIAALINALDLVEKQLDQIKIVICGTGMIAVGCARLLTRLGVPVENIQMYDRKGLMHLKRPALHSYQQPFASKSKELELSQGMQGADVVLGASAGGVLDIKMIRSMNRFPIVFAMATPEPEINYDEARGSRQDVIVATSLDRYPNAIVDLLSFPYILRGALDVQATRITENMLLAAARALAELAREEIVEEVERAYGNKRFTFGPEYLIPKPLDPRIFVRESAAVVRQAIADGVANRPHEDEAYQEELVIRRGTGRETMRGLILRARQEPLRVVFPEGSNETILRASSILVDEGIAQPILLGPEDEIREQVKQLGLNLGGITIVDPARSQRFQTYVDEYFKMRWRDGVMQAAAAERVRQADRYATMMVHMGDADVMVGGFSTHYVESLRTIIEVIGPAEGIKRIASHHMVLLPKDVVILADCAVNIDPDAEELAEIALLTARMSTALGIEPRVAMLSFSNFGSVQHPLAEKVRKACAIVKSRSPELIIDGEMQLETARDNLLRREFFPLTGLERSANILIAPDLQSGNLTMHALQCLGEAVPIGPVLMGTRLPVHLLPYGASVEKLVNLTAIAVVEAIYLRKQKASFLGSDDEDLLGSR
ncbi:NADP-dependent malic enzyme [bacterium]|nr:NADP-dependent malic enzyme [bacterium]MBU1636961.1 NADP-dependent malic enzyme [bacterium]